MPKKCTVTGSEPLCARLRSALRFCIAVLVCLTTLDTGAAPVSALDICVAESNIAQLTPGLTIVPAGGSPASRALFEDARLQPVLHALRIASGLVARTSRQST